MKSFIAEFKDFAMKGNVLDLAVAVVVGAAFGKIVTSLVTDIITPLIGLLMGGVNFSGMAYTVGSATVTYGVFIQSVIDFLLVSFVIFLVVKALNKAHKAIALKEKEETPKEKEPPEDILLLREIRDSLKREE